MKEIIYLYIIAIILIIANIGVSRYRYKEMFQLPRSLLLPIVTPKVPLQAPPQAPPQAPLQAPPQAPPQAPSQAPSQGPPQGPSQAPSQAPSQFYTNNKIPWNDIYQNVSNMETLVDDISNSIPIQFKLGSVSQKVITNPLITNNQTIILSSANCSLVNSFYDLWSSTNDTTADVVKAASQIPIITVDGSVPSNIRFNFIFPTPVSGEIGPIGPTGPDGPDGPMGPPGPMGVQGYWA